MQNLILSKSQFKPKSLEYLRLVEQKSQEITITHGGIPVAKIIPIKGKKLKKDPLNSLKGKVVSYQDPFESVGLNDWDVLK
jgi:prevent-host-death family protein